MYSPQQLREQLVWFWTNQFSIHQGKANGRLLAADYVEQAIRPHVFGHFRDLVLATMTHPAMLQYLDNAQSAAGRVNENYARELLELHNPGRGQRLHPAGCAGTGARADGYRRLGGARNRRN